MDGIYQHFRPEEASVIDSLNEVIVRAKDEYRPILTHFLNPRQHFIADVLIGRFDDVKLKTFGGFSGSERKRILFYPEYYLRTMIFQCRFLKSTIPSSSPNWSIGRFWARLQTVALNAMS